MTDTADREIRLTRFFAAPPEAVFTAWTTAEAVAQWWGPDGFTITTESMLVVPGGMWIYTMHGPDGTDYPNWIRYRTIERPRRLVYEHGGGGDYAAIHFEVTVDFEPIGHGTRVSMRHLFPTAEARDFVVQRYGAIEGGKQHLACLAEYLAQANGPERGRLTLTRTFAAPVATVWQAWTDPVQLARWWGPAGFTNPTCIFEARPGGRIAIAMTDPEGGLHPLEGTVLVVDHEERLVFLGLPGDPQGRPLFEVLNTLTFTAVPEGTRLTITTEVLALTPDIGVPHEGMAVGWNESLDRLEELVGLPARDIVTTRVFPVSSAQAFAAWTDPVQLARWWGPRGFTNVFHQFDLRPGGDWRFTMRGPDGTEYHNHSIFQEIVPAQRLRFDHLGPMHRFAVLTTFAAEAGGTRVSFRMRFDSAEECSRLRPFIAEANEQNFDRLAAVLTPSP